MTNGMTHQEALCVTSMNAEYFGRRILENINFTVKAGQTYGLIGLNGVGKTTLIKIALGLKEPEAGGIAVFGDAAGIPEAKAKIAYLPERFDPPWFLKGGEFVQFVAKLYGRAAPTEDMEKACGLLALDPSVLKNKVQTYSKGMRQKLGLIATVLSGCPMLILDEPMSGLDPLARALVKNMLGAVKREGRTVILSSHILADMDEICDCVTVIDSGGTPFIGTPEELKNRANEVYLEKAFLKVINRAA